MVDIFKNDNLPPPAPQGLRYRSYQEDAIVLARTRKNLLLADEMGLGKGITSIGIINDQPNIRKVLIVCPATLRLNWARELMKWYVGPQIRIDIATTKRWTLADIVIVNYEALKKLHRNIHETSWDLLIVDECHYLKNPNSGRSWEIFGNESKNPMKVRVPLKAERCLFLSGTPITNRPYEIWPVAHYLSRENFSNEQEFVDEFCGGKKSTQKITELGEDNLLLLNKKLTSTIMVRRLKEDCLHELPEKTRQVIILPPDGMRGALSEEQKQFVKIQEALTIARLRAELAKASLDDEIYNREVKNLRRVEFSSLPQIAALRLQTALAKVPLVVKYVLDILESEKKVVIFAHHRAVIENIATEFGEAVAIVHGGISDPIERQRRIDRFQTDTTCRVFIGSLKAAGTGITLTAARIVIFAELDWVPATITQAEDRLHRMGQPYNVLVQHLVLDKSIDANLAQRIKEKQETITATLDPGTEVMASMYSLNKVTPFVQEDREQILEIANQLGREQINQIHDALINTQRRGYISSIPAMDLQLIDILANQEFLEPAQAALGFALLKKHATKKG
jgi:SWI/SNF-related matrix-associated actin-dependent regulator 1 of chromatin subfamily A